MGNSRACVQNDTAVLSRARHTLLWHNVTIGTDFPLFSPSFLFFLCADSLLPQLFREPLTADNLSDSASNHHAHTLTSVLFPLLTTPCALLLRLSALSFHCISEHSPLPESLPSVSLFPCHTCSAHPWCNCLEPGFHFYDYNRGQNAYASRFLLAGVKVEELGRGEQIRPKGV